MSADIDHSFEGRRVLLVEDEGLLRGMLTSVIDSAGFDVLAVANAKDAADACTDFDPDAILCDIDLGTGASGLDLIVSLTRSSPHLGVVILSNYEITAEYQRKWFENARHLRKSDLEDPSIIIEALDDVMRGRISDKDFASNEALGRSSLAGLTKTQVQVLRMVSEGLSNAEIAQRRGSSVRSVEHILQRTFTAMGLENNPSVNIRVAAVRIYLEAAGRPEHSN